MARNYIKVPITMRELIEIDPKELDTLTLYRPDYSGELTEESILYLEDEYIEFDEEKEEEIFPPFVQDNHLSYYFNGDIASDIIYNTRYQLQSPTIQDFLCNFNYYDKRDCFYTFNAD